MSSLESRRRWRLFAFCVFLLAAGLVLPPLWEWADVYPAWRMKAAYVGLGTFVVGLVLLFVWFFSSAGFSARLRVGGAAVLGLLLLGVAAAVREFDFTGDMHPIPRFRWQPSAQSLFDASRKEQPPSQEVGNVDLTIDEVNDFPRYRGPRGDGIVNPAELFSADWKDTPPATVWRHRCGAGFSGFAVAGTVAVTHEQRRGQEVVVCYDRASGRENWAYAYDARFADTFGDGPRATPAIHSHRVYALGGTGVLTCVDGITGRKIWDTSVLGDDNPPVTWGVSGSPLIVEDLGIVVVAPGGKKGPSLAAYDLLDGTPKWTGGELGGGYASPLLATLAGRRQIVLFDVGGLAGFDVADGKELWRHEWKTFMGMNIIQPIVLSDDRVFVSSEASNGSAMLQIAKSDDGFSVSVLWETKDLASKFSNPIALGGAIFGLSNGTLVCLDERTGARQWRGRRYGHGQLLAAGGQLIVVSERGAVALVAADRNAFKQLALFDVFEDKTWNTPALAGRRLFLRNAAEMACVELPRR